MVNFRDQHTPTKAGRLAIQRTTPHRPATRTDGQRPSARPVDSVLADLAQTRRRYEDLRLSSGPLDERARLMSVLHELRAEAFLARNSSRRM